MSFGWSIGDLVTAIEILIQVGAALKENDGAPSRYQESSDYLQSLASVLTRLKMAGPSLACIQEDIEAIREPIMQFNDQLKTQFEDVLGKQRKTDWKSLLRNAPKKVQYALYVATKVQDLRSRIEGPLNSIKLGLGLETFNLGLETHELVSRLGTAVPKSLKDVQSTIDSRLKEQQSRQDKAERERLLEAVLHWLDPLPVIDTHNDILEGVLDGSCKWLFEKSEYIRWQDQPRTGRQMSMLWVSGIPGAGKTRLATATIRRLQKDGKVAYFYCDTKDEKRRPVLGILRTLVWQLLTQDNAQLETITEIKSAGAPPNESNMGESLGRLCENGGCTLILDALDECEPDARKKLCRLLALFSKRARVVVFSRDVSDIRSNIYHSSSGVVHIHITKTDNEFDIRHFIEQEAKTLDLEDEDLEKTVIESLLAGANGMFLWAALMIQELSKTFMFFAADYGESIRNAVQGLPQDLDELYARLLTTLAAAKPWKWSQKLFQWLACAQRPLSLEEIGAALKIAIDESIMNRAARAQIRTVISECCGPLVRFDESVIGITTVYLIHTSVKDFLLGSSRQHPEFRQLLVNPSETHMLLAQACLTYLCYDNIGFAPFGPLSGGPNSVGEALDNMDHKFERHMMEFPLLGYATLNWWQHLALAAVTRSGCLTLKRLYSSERNTLKWVQIFHRLRGDRGQYRSSTGQLDLQVIYDLLSKLTEDMAGYTEWLNHLEGTPKWDCQYGRWNRLLYSGGANDFLSELHLAAFFDYVNFVEQCLDQGADVDLPTHTGQTPLIMATRGRSVNTAAALLHAGAALEAGQRWKGNTSLDWSLEWNDWEAGKLMPLGVTPLLLDAGADTCHVSDNGETCLNKACQLSFPEDPRVLDIVTRLLSYGAIKIIDTGTEFTPLHWAARRGALSLVKLLLKEGARVDPISSQDHATPLLSVCANPEMNLDLVRALLEAGASTKAQTSDGRTVLHLSARSRAELPDLLLQYGAAVNVSANDGSLPLHDTVRERNDPLVRLLLQKGSELDRKDNTGRTPLEIAVDNGYSLGIELLVAAGASYDGKGWLFEKKDGNLHIHRRDGAYWPRRSRDILETCWLLQSHTSLKSLPRLIVVHILDLAEYWLKSSSSRAETVRVDDKESEQAPPYVTSMPILGRLKAPVQRIIITTHSHDQGFSSFREDYGTYSNSWTWLELDVVKSDGQPVDFGEESRLLTANVHASFKRREHQIAYGDRPGMRQSGWLYRLEPGDTVSIMARARYRGWVNFVEEAAIEIFTTCLLDEKVR